MVAPLSEVEPEQLLPVIVGPRPAPGGANHQERSDWEYQLSERQSAIGPFVPSRAVVLALVGEASDGLARL